MSQFLPLLAISYFDIRNKFPSGALHLISFLKENKRRPKKELQDFLFYTA